MSKKWKMKNNPEKIIWETKTPEKKENKIGQKTKYFEKKIKK